MNIPGFSAEASLYKTSGHYYSVGAFSQTVDNIQSQSCDPNRLRKCLDECGNPDPDGRDRGVVARCRTGCYRTFGQCAPPPPPPPVPCNGGVCDPGFTCCPGVGCAPPGTFCCGTGVCRVGTNCCGTYCAGCIDFPIVGRICAPCV